MSAPQFKIKRRVTNQVLQIVPNAGERFFKFHKPMELGKKLDDQKAAAMLLEATDLVSGEYGVIIVPTILQNDLNEHFPDASYVGKCFCVTVTRNTAKKYNHVSLAEIDDPTANVVDAALPAAEQPDAEQVSAEHAVAEQVAAEQAYAEQVAAEQAADLDAGTPAPSRQGRRHR